MPGKTKETADKIAVLKGQAAEDAVLQYLKKMNRPFGAVDVSANLKGAVPKTATQKILAGLADKGEITQKPYGKTVFYVAKQTDIEDVSAEKLSAIEAEVKDINEENKQLAEEVKKLTSDLIKLKSTPTDEEVAKQSAVARAGIAKTLGYLEPLRAGITTLLTQEEVTQLDADWQKWYAEWIKRRKAFYSLWSLLADNFSKTQADELAEELGIEYDSAEHKDIETGPLCVRPKRR